MKPRYTVFLLSLSLGVILALAWLLAGRPLPTHASPRDCTPGPHSGTLAASETWCASDNPHIMTAYVIVPEGITLTLESGAIVQGANWITDLRIEGHLEAVGTSSQPITITSLTDSGPDQWAGLYFNGGDGNLDYVTVRYGGTLSHYTGKPGNVILRNVQDGLVRIQHSRILDVGNIAGNTVHGLFVENSRLELTDTFFSGNAVESGGGVEDDGYPMAIIGVSSVVTMTGNIFTGNLHDRVLLGDWGGHPMTANAQATLYRQAALEGYEFGTNYTIPAGMTLHVEPGVTLMSRWGQGIQVLGRLEAIGTAAQPITITSATNTGPNQWGDLYFNGGTGKLDHVTVRYGGACGGGCLSANIILRNVGGAGVQISNSFIAEVDSPGNSPAGLLMINSVAVVANTVLADIGSESTAAALRIVGADSQVQLTNVAVIRTGLPGGGGKAIRVEGGASLSAVHTTIAGNRGDGISVNGASAIFTNTILSDNSVGVRVESGGVVTMTQTLWDRNVTPVVGVIQETGHLEGFAGLDTDGCHLTRYSAALSQGLDSGTAEDLDGESRPQPAGTAPDLGSDEFLYNPNDFFVAETVAFDPQWVILPDPESGEPYGLMRQQYMLRYYYGSPNPNPPALTVTITDTLPDELTFEYETHNPAMSLNQSGQTLTWQTQAPVQAGQSGGILLSGWYDQPEPGRTLVNQSAFRAPGYHFDLQTITETPLFPPLIISPGSGEICPDPSGNVTVSGMAQGGAVIRVYENGVEVISTTAATSGAFTAVYPSTHAGIDPQTTITAEACAPSDPDHCSDPSQPIYLTEALSFWCPQRSLWEDDVNGQHVAYQFRSASGRFSTQNWVISGILGFNDTDLTLHTCNCPAASGTTAPPSSVWVVADGVTYNPTGSHPEYHFDITGGAHNVVFWAQCGSNQVSSEGDILIDPDGYVFDITQGFDALDPTLHAIQGVTVTAYVSMPQWGGWIPWPAQLYNDQQNPQVTGDDGYFAFFTPPGYYYLQVDGPEGYQSWRSPVVEVITEVVHVNVPLTPDGLAAAQQILLTPNGPDLPVITITAGSEVTWMADLADDLAPEWVTALYANPHLHVVSQLDPLNNTLGWDSGLMAPGSVYHRRFDAPGVYLYTDGNGHTGKVIVLVKIYLPMIRR